MTTTRKAVLLAACTPAVAMVVVAMVDPSTTAGGLIRTLSVLLVGLALLLLPSASEEARPKARALIDGAIVASALWAIIYQVISIASIGNKSLTPNLLAFLALNLLTLGVAATLAVRVAAFVRRAAWLIVLGLAFQTAAATWQLVQFVSSKAVTVPWSIALTGLVIVGAICICAGLFLAANNERADVVESAESSQLWRRVAGALPTTMVVVVIAMAVVMAFDGRTITSVDYLTGVVFLGLLVIHQMVANRERMLLMARLQSRGALFQSLVTGSTDLITLHDSSGRVLYASPAVYRLLGRTETQVIDETVWEAVHPDDRVGVERAAARALATPSGTVEHVMRVRKHVPPRETYSPDADSANEWEWRWMQTAMRNLIDDENVQGVVCNTRDIHDQHELGKRLSHEAYHDALTGLGNLALARQIFAEHSYGVDRTPTTLLLADLDGFKNLNDTFGHAFGDDLLVAVARRLRTSVSDDDAIARIGGDEFVLIFDDEREARASAAAILEALHKPVLVQGTSVIVHASIGIARSIDATSSEELLRNADLAMYEAKAIGGNTFVSYDETMFEQTSRRMQIQEGLRSAIENDRFELVFQPIIDLRTRTITGAEALLRWTDPDLGRVPPDVFIPVAESSGFIAAIDKWVLTAACSHIKSWRAKGLSVPVISINVSRRQITDGLEGLIAEVIAETGVAAKDICIEVTESAVVPDPEAAARVLQGVRDLGSLVALDDFGTGQSSLSQLAQLPIDRVKIDRSFVMPSSHDASALDLLSSIVGLCRSLELPIVAEGIEDDQAAQNLVAMGAQYGQGYYFYRPMPDVDFEELIRASIPYQRQESVATTVETVLSADEFEVVTDKQSRRADARNRE